MSLTAHTCMGTKILTSFGFYSLVGLRCHTNILCCKQYSSIKHDSTCIPTSLLCVINTSISLQASLMIHRIMVDALHCMSYLFVLFYIYVVQDILVIGLTVLGRLSYLLLGLVHSVCIVHFVL